jgi:DNA-directed RNA polymerase subunit RPC12/RpoP
MSSTESGPTPADAFAALADPTRVGIVRSLGGAATDDPTEVPYLPFDHPERGLTYSALRERVDVADSGRFNYHLKKLLGSFVEQRDDRYRLTWLGVVAYRVLVAGRFSASPATRRFDLDHGCHRCGDRVEARYTADQVLYVDCTGCGLRTMMIHVPQHGVADASRERLLSAGATRYRTHLRSLTADHCPWCSGRVASTVEPASDERRSVGATLLSHPAVVSFYHDRGVDLRDDHPWTVPFAFAPDRTTVVSHDPLRIRVEARCAGDRCRVMVGGDATVRDVTVTGDPDE